MQTSTTKFWIVHSYNPTILEAFESMPKLNRFFPTMEVLNAILVSPPHCFLPAYFSVIRSYLSLWLSATFYSCGPEDTSSPCRTNGEGIGPHRPFNMTRVKYWICGVHGYSQHKNISNGIPHPVPVSIKRCVFEDVLSAVYAPCLRLTQWGQRNNFWTPSHHVPCPNDHS